MSLQELNTVAPHRRSHWRRGLPAKACVLSSLSRDSNSMSMSLSWVLLSFARSPFLSQPHSPAAQRRERADWVSETLTTPARYTHAVLILGSSLCQTSALHSVWPWGQWGLTYCHMCTYCVLSVFLFLSHHSKHDKQPFPLTENRITIQLSSSVFNSEVIKNEKKTTKKNHWVALALWSSQVLTTKSLLTYWQEVHKRFHHPRQFSVFLVSVVS